MGDVSFEIRADSTLCPSRRFASRAGGTDLRGAHAIGRGGTRCGARRPALADPRRGGNCPAYGGPRRHGREYRATVRSACAGVPERRSAVGGNCLCAAFGSLLLVGGRLGDMFSRKWVFISGLIGFAIASAIGGAAGPFLVLVAARALQGAFGAILAPSALGTLVSTFRDPRERGRAFGVFGSVAAGGGAVGLILGGGAHPVPLVAVVPVRQPGFAVIAVAGALAWISSSRPAVRPRMDFGQAPGGRQRVVPCRLRLFPCRVPQAGPPR